MSLSEYNNNQHSPFKVPEGYFESLESNVMKRIASSDKTVKTTRKTSVKPLWHVLPFVGVAAAVILAFVIVGLPPESLPSGSDNSATEIKITQDISDRNIESVYDYLVLDNETIYDYATE